MGDIDKIQQNALMARYVLQVLNMPGTVNFCVEKTKAFSVTEESF